jgi:hypothetical protein
MEDKFFRQEEIEAIGAALGETGDCLTGSEIGHILSACHMADPAPETTKRHRIHNALAADQNSRATDRCARLHASRHEAGT